MPRTSNKSCHRGNLYLYRRAAIFVTGGIQPLQKLRRDIIGMTNVPESYLAKEAGMAYTTVAMVTDYDCWREEHCTVEEIMRVMLQNNQTAQKLFKTLIPKLAQNKFEYEKENAVGVMTPKEHLSPEKQEILEVLLS